MSDNGPVGAETSRTPSQLSTLLWNPSLPGLVQHLSKTHPLPIPVEVDLPNQTQEISHQETHSQEEPTLLQRMAGLGSLESSKKQLNPFVKKDEQNICARRNPQNTRGEL